jgi:hypothetical protein
MSFRQIFDRITRIARAEAFGTRGSSYEEELRRAEELIEESRRPRRTTIDESADAAEPQSEEEAEAYRVALRTIGVRAGATREQIATAYRQRARELHPDRVGHMSPEEQREALRRMQELNLAYEFLRRRAGA